MNQDTRAEKESRLKDLLFSLKEVQKKEDAIKKEIRETLQSLLGRL